MTCCPETDSGVADTATNKNQTQNPNILKTGLGGLDTLANAYFVHKRDMASANRLAQAKSRDFDMPTVMAGAVIIARRHVGLLNVLAKTLPLIVEDFYNLRAQFQYDTEKMKEMLAVSVKAPKTKSHKKSKK